MLLIVVVVMVVWFRAAAADSGCGLWWLSLMVIVGYGECSL